MQTVVENDSLWSHWVAREQNPDGTPGDVVDISGATVVIHVIANRPGAVASTLPGEVVDGPAGEFRHQYNGLPPEVYLLEARFNGLPGIGTAPTNQPTLFRVRPKIG